MIGGITGGQSVPLLAMKADILVFGLGEKQILEIVNGASRGNRERPLNYITSPVRIQSYSHDYHAKCAIAPVGTGPGTFQRAREAEGANGRDRLHEGGCRVLRGCGRQIHPSPTSAPEIHKHPGLA